MNFISDIKHLLGGHGSHEYLEFKLKMLPLITELKEIESDLKDNAVEIESLGESKGQFRDKWNYAAECIGKTVYSYQPMISQMSKWGVFVKDQNLPQYKKDLRFLIKKSFSKLFMKEFNNVVKIIKSLNDDSLRLFGKNSEEVTYTGGTLIRLNQLKQKIDELVINAEQFLKE